MKFLQTVLIASGVTWSLAQFVPSPTDLIEKVGAAGINVRYKRVSVGICELDPDVNNFSGYSDVNSDQHIFWWFFEAREKPENKPVTIWLSGGPGASSMVTIFNGVGPCRLDSQLHVHDNPYSWTKETNVLFIDQPTQVGLSYSVPVSGYIRDGKIIELDYTSCPSNASQCGTYPRPDANLTSQTTEGGAPTFWKTLQGFFGAFPQYAKNGVILATVSFGGHYGPVYSNYIWKQNDNLPPGAVKILLTSLTIGNGLLDPLIQMPAQYNFTLDNPYNISFFNETVHKKMFDGLYNPGGCIDKTKICYANGTDSQCSDAGDVCYAATKEWYDKEATGRDAYDTRYLKPTPFPSTFHIRYLNTLKVQQALGAYTNFTSTSSFVESLYLKTGADARVITVMDDIRGLVKRGIRVLLYFGDADFLCNWTGAEAVAQRLHTWGFSKAGYVDIETPDGTVHGHVRQFGNFALARVFYAGHAVTFFSPVLSLAMLRRISEGLDIATGREKFERSFTVGKKSSEFREGNATVQWAVVPKNATYNFVTNQPDL